MGMPRIGEMRGNATIGSESEEVGELVLASMAGFLQLFLDLSGDK